MKNYARLDHAKKRIVMDRTFAKNSEIVGSTEYNQLQKVRKAYPNYTVERREIKKKEGQNRYKGMDYDWMRDYIRRNEEAEYVSLMLDKFETVLVDMEGISKGHAYPRVKSWFLKNYPEVKQIGKLIERRTQIGGENAVVSINDVA